MTILSTLSGLVGLALSASLFGPAAHAETWRAIALGSTPDTSTAEYHFPAASFIDGSYVGNGLVANSFVLSDNANLSDTPESISDVRTTISFSTFAGPGSSPPRVDTDAMTIDLSSIWAHATNAIASGAICDPRARTCSRFRWFGALGWAFGPVEPVPYTANPDGSFTAYWIGAEDRSNRTYNDFLGDPLYFTFAPVPEPGPAVLFAVGVAVLFGWRRRSVRR